MEHSPVNGATAPQPHEKRDASRASAGSQTWRHPPVRTECSCMEQILLVLERHAVTPKALEHLRKRS